MEEIFEQFAKIPRLSRECIITEKIDGTNAQILIADDFTTIKVGSRTRWITPQDDNYGFARWVEEHKDDVLKLGPGRHFGEWWGGGIQRGYGFKKGEKFFSLFNTSRWDESNLPACIKVVPIIYKGIFSSDAVNEALMLLASRGSYAAPGFMKPEGVVIYHVAGGLFFKKTIEGDEAPKGIR